MKRTGLVAILSAVVLLAVYFCPCVAAAPSFTPAVSKTSCCAGMPDCPARNLGKIAAVPSGNERVYDIPIKTAGVALPGYETEAKPEYSLLSVSSGRSPTHPPRDLVILNSSLLV